MPDDWIVSTSPRGGITLHNEVVELCCSVLCTWLGSIYKNDGEGKAGY